MTVSAVVFDFDHTLTFGGRSRQEILDESTAAVGAPDMTREDYLDAHSRHLDSDSRVPIFAELLPEDSDVDPEALADAYREKVADSLEAVAGVSGMLADLKEEYALGMLTNGPAEAQQAKLDRFDWVDYFDAVVITGNIDAGKPDERAFRAVLDELGVEPAQAVYVGDDTEADVLGAKRAGMYAIQVVFEDGPDPHDEADAHVRREDIATELPRAIESL